MAKRRVFVAFEEEDPESKERKRQKKIVVSVDSTATNNDLAKEIAKFLNRESDDFTLELPGGFELRPEDLVQDIIRDDELVTTRVVRNTQHEVDADPANPIVNLKPTLDSQSPTYSSPVHHVAEPHELSRIQIRLVSPELASRNTDSDGILAFEGEFISGNTTLHALRREAARVFGWISDHSMIVDDDDDANQCDHQHDKGIACSCELALQIEQHGLFSTLHCRFVLDGEHCSNLECPYSHSKLNHVDDLSTPPHCIICGDFLGFPCPKCMQHAVSNGLQPAQVLDCPLVQNAGCGHLHHAHCVRLNKGSVASCPSGCAREKFPGEASIFDPPTPQIIVAWDGDKVDKIPLPTWQGTPIQLTSDEVIRFVREFLISRKFALPDLSLRIHSRNPVTETVSFTQSTLVSICHASTHTQQAHHRFRLFPNQDARPASIPKRGFHWHVDLHTSQFPVIACGCTRLRDLFCTESGTRVDISVLLYAVKRKVEYGEAPAQVLAISREKTFLFDKAWQPSVLQSLRGMAAFLSCLYCLTDLISLKGVAAEASVLSVMHQVTRFPPAVRALDILLLNRDVRAEGRAALAEAMYHALKDFLSRSCRGPVAIISNPNRFFEASRILLAHVIETAKKVEIPAEQPPNRPLEEIQLVCTTSRKLLKDPVLMDSQVVDRGSAALHLPGGELYRPAAMPIIAEMTTEENDRLKRAVMLCGALTVADARIQSTMIFDVDALLPAPPSLTLAQIGRDLVSAIEAANQTDLVTRGPLDLKSVNIIPPQLVLDQEGLLAVFTGRGCGATCGVTGGVNLFRPTNGGDTEVDVNDVSYALEKVIEQRKLEDTWQIDTFGGVSAVPIRPPDEAIVLCLDLSRSMKQRSGVSRRSAAMFPDEDDFDPEAASWKLLEDLAKDISESDILQAATDYVLAQDSSCHRAWKFYIDRLREDEYDDLEDSQAAIDLLHELGIIARRDALNLSLALESQASNFRMKNKMIKLAHFSTACDSQTMELSAFLEEFLDELSEDDDVGVEPYQVPRRLIDPKTGDLLVDPVIPDNAPHFSTFVNEESREWFEDQDLWPTGLVELNNVHFEDVEDVEAAVADWISGKDILPVSDVNSSLQGEGPGEGPSETCGDAIRVTLVHEGNTIEWDLSIDTSTRTLYSLVNRVTRARYSRFTLRMSTSKATIIDSAYRTLGLTDLSHGGMIELCFTYPHKRKPAEVTVSNEVSAQVVFLPQDANILALMSCLDTDTFGTISCMQLWHGMMPAGDGFRHGSTVQHHHNLKYYGSGPTYEFEWNSWKITGFQKQQRKSRHLERLDVLKELFNVFIDRASSLDTSVSLVLGLVTFSDKVVVKQELTPIFENFKQELNKVSAGGDTAIYDALDAARRMLVNYRTDMPKLRKRIIIVTDGVDTSSETSAKTVCQSLQRSSIIVDSVQVGDKPDRKLHAISVATGGYRFCPQTSLSDALSIFDLETILSSAERIPRPPQPLVLHDFALADLGNTLQFPVDIVTISQFPSRAPHTKLQETVKPAANLSAAPGDQRTKRIMRELKALVTDPHPHMDLYVNESDISFLKIILEAPKDDTKCPYRNGTFLLTCDIPETYPRDPPEIRFVTFILHPNVSKQGKICVAELGRLWSSDITLKDIFSLIYGLLLEPDLENPVEIQASLKYYDDDGTFALVVADAVTEFASKSREQWRQELEDASE